MSGLTRATAVGTTLVAALALVVGTHPAGGAAPKAKDTYAKAKVAATPVKGTLAADAKLTSPELAAHIDKLIDQKLKSEKVDASPLADDAEFLRRVYLDVTGKIPTAEKAAAFLDSKDANKRAKLIDELLESKEYGKHQADIWQALLLPKDSDSFRIRRFFPAMVKWLEDTFNDNKGWDKVAKDLLTSTGAVDKGPTVYYLANQSVDKMTDNVTKVFLGVQLQ